MLLIRNAVDGTSILLQQLEQAHIEPHPSICGGNV